MKIPDRARLAQLISSLTIVEGAASWIDTASNPRQLERLGQEIAECFRGDQSQAIVCWRSPDEVVLAHAVAHTLDIPVARLESDLGLLELDPPLPSEVQRVLVLSTVWTATRPADTLLALLENMETSVVAVVAVLPGERRLERLSPDTPYVNLTQP